MDVEKTNNTFGDFTDGVKHNNKNCKLGEIIDYIVDSYYAKWLDYYTANMLAIKDLVEHITTIHNKANDLLKSLLKGENQNDRIDD